MAVIRKCESPATLGSRPGSFESEAALLRGFLNRKANWVIFFFVSTLVMYIIAGV